MKIFIDTANIDEIRKANAWGIIDGVTTNPSLVAKTGRTLEEVVREICAIVDGPISAEVVSVDANGMVEEGERLAAIHPNIVVKVPMIPEGLKATKILSSRGIPVNVTLIFSPAQALLAAKAGAAYASPFVGRLDDIAEDGLHLIKQIVRIYQNYTYATQVLVASVRHPVHFVQAAELGAHIATCPFSVIQQIMKHPLTDIGLERFLADHHKAMQR
ncbi:MAG TPA: fructose-6-phosphate aldolase [Methylomirabilota bacterium]|jgi:transaldolase|nr:fructose-6-phosphate aldolase [Methylomirabilota bacterium]